jgi:hypothetical protein
MSPFFEIVQPLTTSAAGPVDKALVTSFAREFGWTPSYSLHPSVEKDFANIHLIVEHGLENSAVLTFLKKPYGELEEKERRELLSISYNNLVDWHIHIDREKATYVYNRSTPPDHVIDEKPFRNDYYEALRSEAFERLVGKKPSPNIPALDDALIDTISYWKRIISSELDNKVDNLSFSTLFNSIIFIRAFEDNLRRYGNHLREHSVLITAWHDSKPKTITTLVKTAQKILNRGPIPPYLIDSSLLKPFDNLDPQLLQGVIDDFYRNRVAGYYRYDFSIMSKHALSRIYERYSALLKVEESDQLNLFGKIPIEEPNKAYGAIYTPEYIARFFCRFLETNLAPSVFVRTRVCEPAVGSGIFLRTLLEAKCEPTAGKVQPDNVRMAFENILGIDVDGNACQAAKLSLALLHLVLLDEFPRELNILQAEAVDYMTSNKHVRGNFDIVLSNPPFVATERLSRELKERINNYLGEHRKGRTDSYLAFLKAGVELLKPHGFGLFVLPHSFLISKNAVKLREYIAKECWIRCVADLSAIPVFGNTGIYVVLLIFQKRSDHVNEIPPATIIKAREFAGRALEDGIDRRFSDTKFYSVFEVGQSFFGESEWTILPPKEITLQEKIRRFKPIKEYLNVRQGFVSGADEVFIRSKSEIPVDEGEIYVPFLPDREIDRYVVPEEVSHFLIYPYSKGEKLSEARMKKYFPKTWKYLKSKEKVLKAKKSFADVSDWWRPLRTRDPEHLLVPKIVTPHLTITPKFTVDLEGRFAVSRSPFLISKINPLREREFLLFFLGILNSTPCYWYISNHSHKYSKGYAMMEVRTLAETPVPDPALVPKSSLKKMITLVNDALSSDYFSKVGIQKEIDLLACDLYQLNQDERKLLGLSL